MTKGSLGELKNLHFITVLSVRHARSDERVARRRDKFAFRRAQSDEKVARARERFAFYHSFEHPVTRRLSNPQVRSQRPDRRKIILRLFQRIWFGSLSLQSFSLVLFSNLFKICSLFSSLRRQPALQQNFGQSLMTVFKDSHHFSRTLSSLL